MYRLTRDDGTELQVDGGIWEAALELAYFYGWRPAGTQTPRTVGWRGRLASPGAPVWNSRDYFSHELQHVGDRDARALAEGVLRALLNIPVMPREESRSTVGAMSPSPIPSRESALADGLSVHRRKVMNRFAEFADHGGFTIGRVL